MIKLTKRDKHELFLNCDQIESIEETPDTVITMVNGHRHLVTESAAEAIDRIMEFRAAILRRAPSPASPAASGRPERADNEATP
jgi:flagellar protein FlbD